MTALDAPHFHDETKAREYLESLLWPDGPLCPHCGSAEEHYELRGKAHRAGLRKCSDCRQQFTVTVGTIFQRSRIPLSKWLLAGDLLCCNKKGITNRELQRMLGVSYKSAWFLAHRIRGAIGAGHLSRRK